MEEEELMEAVQSNDEMSIGILNPDAVAIEDGEGGVVIDFTPPEEMEEEQISFDANLAEHMDEGELGSLAGDLIAAYDDDRSSRG